MGNKECHEQKPQLFLLPGESITAEDIAAMYKALTGKDTSPMKLEECRARLAAKLKK